MPSKTLTTHDLNVLEKIKDPESAPSVLVLINSTLPKDPHFTNMSEYERIASLERQIILEFRNVETELASSSSTVSPTQSKVISDSDACIERLKDLKMSYPSYASAHNNHAQALRHKFGDSVLLKTSSPLPGLTTAHPSQEKEIIEAATTILHSLDTAISLLSPLTPFAPISPQAARTLSQAHTQRGALYHVTAKQMNSDPRARLRIAEAWTPDDLEEMASRDFMMGGRYGNEIAKGLAVATNPTAKLCGSIVREAMRKEFGGLAT